VRHPTFTFVIARALPGDATRRALVGGLCDRVSDPECSAALSAWLSAASALSAADLALLLPIVRAGTHLRRFAVEKLLACVRASLTRIRTATIACEFADALFRHSAVRTRFDPSDMVYIDAVSAAVSAAERGDPAVAAIAAFARSYPARAATIKYLRTRRSVGALFLLFTLLVDSGEAEAIQEEASQTGLVGFNALALLCPEEAVPAFARDALAVLVIEGPLVPIGEGARQFLDAAVRGISADEVAVLLARITKHREFTPDEPAVVALLVAQ
jgi:hypothetical protein